MCIILKAKRIYVWNCIFLYDYKDGVCILQNLPWPDLIYFQFLNQNEHWGRNWLGRTRLTWKFHNQNWTFYNLRVSKLYILSRHYILCATAEMHSFHCIICVKRLSFNQRWQLFGPIDLQMGNLLLHSLSLYTLYN